MSDHSEDSVSIIDLVESVLAEDEWHYERNEETNVILSGVKCKNTTLRLAFDAKDESEILLMYGLLDGHAPADKMAEAAEFITRANFALLVGNFEMDYADGEIRFKVSVDFEGGTLTPIMIRNMISYCAITVNRYYGSLMGVLFGNLDPAEAAMAAEEGDHDDDDYEHSEDCDHDAFDIEIDDSDEKPEDRA